MSADFKPPSEKITKLKLFLEKNKNDFARENTQLRDWIQDRGLEVDKLHLGDFEESQPASNETETVEARVIEEFRQEEVVEYHQLEADISLEEYQTIFEKLLSLLDLPAGQLEEQSELYLEQQLSDLLGFDIVAEIDNQRLNHSTGIMHAEPHLKRHPKDELKNHQNVPEAGISKYRSAFGWFTSHGEITKKIEQLERYYFSLQLYHLEHWSSQYKELKQWYKFRKMIVINPADRIAVVGVVGNIDHRSQIKKQFGCSPEVIREGMIWSPNARGKVLLMFVDDPDDKVPLGPIYFDKLIKNGNTEEKNG